MLLGDDVGVVLGLDTGLDEEVELDLLHVLVVHADLVVAAHERSELIPQLRVVVLFSI